MENEEIPYSRLEDYMVRKIIKINEELCNGCGLCVNACHEAAIGLVNGKAKLLRDDYCDGLGNCLPACPTNAISFEEREALAYDEEEVKKNMQNNNKVQSNMEHNEKPEFHQGCPGSRMMELKKQESLENMVSSNPNAGVNQAAADGNTPAVSMLRQWPVQMQLVPVNAPYFNDADLLIAADCTAYAYGDFHRFMKNKITLIGCPKLDEADYAEKLYQILASNQIRSITIIRMEVPCCGGIVNAAKSALLKSGNLIPWRVITISTDGTILSDM